MDAQVHRTDAELGGAPEGLDALIVAERVKTLGGVGLFVARDYQRSGSFVQAFQFFTQDIEVLEYPAWDCLPYDRLSPTAGIAAQRMATLTRLAQRKPDDAPVLVVTTVSAAMQRTPPRSVTTLAGFDAKVGRDLDIQALERYFAANGYVRASTVSERGEFAVRGGVVDVFPPGFAEPVRLDMFGSELESIRTFDPETQRSTGQMKAVALAPVSEALLDKEAISRFRTGYLNLFGAPGDDPLYATISEGARRQGMEQWLPLFYDGLDTLFDYLPDQAQVFLDNQVETARSERWDLVADAYEARAEAAKTKGGASANRALPPKRLYLDEGDWNQALAGRAVRRFTPFSSGGEDAGGRLGRTFGAERAQDSVNLFEAVAAHAQTLKSEGKRVLFASWTEGSSDRLATMLADHGLDHIVAVRDWDDVQNAPKDIYLRGVLPVEHGFVTDDVAVICETDILGDRLARPRKKRRASNFLAEASALTTGDLVVHLDHGIGRYEGLKTLDIQQAPHDCLELLYAGESKLYLPVENIDLLTRYGSDSEGAQLDRLGGAGWQARKAKAKERLRAMAEGLIALAAKRALRETEAVVPPSGLFAEFCARFPYEETDDQLNAIGDVLEDLGKGTPMDRLICGDVGFGKTEVALRAAFVVAMTGQQVAIVAPTTLLVRPPVKVRQLSRMVGSKEAAETRQGLKDGSVEIVVGTHAVLSEQVGFRDLGLVIVDEEQHFGVKHKEKLKTLRADVHLLTLTATPIPRTLQMALSGIREMSIIATPPVDRLAVRTYVTPWDPVLVREALLREKYRGGQAYYVAPRLKDLPDIEKFLREQVPEVKFVVGHGQMSATQLEEVMSAFYDGEYDVLVSTTIVESGLDIPTANTLVVHRADMFGLAQLYQIRGRVGRSKARAFAYLTTDAVKPMTLSAERRLQVLQSLDNLGAGFQLASHDLDQRGGGNLLGDEQSGHIREVGVELYQQMLEDAVAELRENGEPGAVDRGWSPSINVGASVLIPENYVPDLNVRLSLYRRLSDAEQAEDREALAAELIDRFGPLPDEAQQLLKIVGIKANCRKACIEKIDIGPRGAVLTLRDNSFPNPVGLVGLIQKNQAFWKIRPDQKIVVSGDWPTAEDRLKVAERITADLARVAGA
jgi:transcription-repair coupling factor (superfamily II helicase)